MSFFCDGSCGDATCRKEFLKASSLRMHILGSRHRGRRSKTSSGSVSTPGDAMHSVTSLPQPEPSAKSPAEPFYPTWSEWTSSESTGAGKGISPPPPTAPAPTVPLLTAEAIVALCDMIDIVALKTLNRKIYNMTMQKAKMVEASLASLPVQVTQPLAPIVVPWYVPVLAITFPILVLPAVIALAQFGIERLKERREKKDRASGGQRPTGGTETRHVSPEVFGPSEGNTHPEKFPPPPVIFRAQPWHEPGEA